MSDPGGSTAQQMAQGGGRGTAALLVLAGLVLIAALAGVALDRVPALPGLVAAGACGLILLWRGLSAQRAIGEARRQALFTGRVFAASETVLSSLDVTHVLRNAAEAGARLSWHASGALLYLVDEGRRPTLRSSFGLDPPPDAGTRFPAVDAHIAEVLKARRSAVTALPPASGQRGLDAFRSACVLPLQSKGGMVGVLAVLSAKTPGAFRQEQTILEYFASQAAMAIDNARLYQQVQDLFLSAIKALAAAVDAKDAYTHGHSEDIAQLVSMIARELKVPPHEEEKVKLAGLLHDVGKIGIPDAILRKPGRLDPSERAIMMSHAALGASIIDKPGPLRDLVGIVRHHHERHDGRGYPDGLRADEIPVGAAILSVADAFDAMTSYRAYHTARQVDVALDELRKNAGTQFNPRIVEALVRVIDRERGARSEWYTSLEHRIADPSGGQQPLLPSTATSGDTEMALRLAQEVRHLGELPALLDRLTEIAPPALGVDEFAVLLIDDHEQALIVEAAAGAGLQKGSVIPQGRSAAWRAIEQKAAQRGEDGATIYAPLITGGVTIGALQATAQGAGDGHLRLLSLVADAVAPSIHAARLHKRAVEEGERDGLTGLFNRKVMLARLKEEANRHQRHGAPFAVALASVRELPQFNTAFGFGAGDELIRRIGEVLRDNLRTSDIVGRVAGGTFAVLMPELDAADAERGLHRLQALFADRHIPIKGQFIQTPALTWVLARCPHDGRDGDALFGRAERLLFGQSGD